jgi:hypothetical protein
MPALPSRPNLDAQARAVWSDYALDLLRNHLRGRRLHPERAAYHRAEVRRYAGMARRMRG